MVVCGGGVQLGRRRALRRQVGVSRRRRLCPEDASLNGVVLHTACRSSSRETLEISARMTATESVTSSTVDSIRTRQDSITEHGLDVLQRGHPGVHVRGEALEMTPRRASRVESWEAMWSSMEWWRSAWKDSGGSLDQLAWRRTILSVLAAKRTSSRVLHR